MVNFENLTEPIKIISSSGIARLVVPKHLLLGHNLYGKSLNAQTLDFMIDYYYNPKVTRTNRNIRKRIDKEIGKIKAIKSINKKYLKFQRNILAEYYQRLPLIIEKSFDICNKDTKERILGLLRTLIRSI